MHNITPDEFFFLLKGAQWTVALSAIGLGLGAIAGLLIALARTSTIAVLRRVTGAYIAVFQGTPLLMQLFMTYYGLVLIGLKLDAWQAVAIGFTLHDSAFLGEIWRGSIEAVPRGQTEAANALGIHYTTRMRRVILPQALRISLPAIVGFTELARSGSIVSNQTFKPLVVYALVGLIYFALCWPLSLYSKRLEANLAKAAR